MRIGIFLTSTDDYCAKALPPHSPHLHVDIFKEFEVNGTTITQPDLTWDLIFSRLVEMLTEREILSKGGSRIALNTLSKGWMTPIPTQKSTRDLRSLHVGTKST